MKQKFHLEDLRSGLVVFLVALPLCLGIALASSAKEIPVPLLAGLFAGVIGGIVVGLVSNSRLSVSGPAAGLTLVVSSALVTLGSFNAFLVAVIMAGIIQLILGFVKAGTIANYLPSAAIKGMLCGIGIILLLKQIPHFFGYDKDPEGDLNLFQVDGENTFSELINAINFICPPSLIIGIISILILVIWETKKLKTHRILSQIPAPLLVVLAGIGLTEVFSAMGGIWHIENEHMVNFPNVVKDLREKPLEEVFFLPDFSVLSNPQVYKIALVIAAVASVETLLCIEAVDKLDPQKHNTNNNRELLAQGTGNIILGFIGGLPITSVIVRSSANLNAGAKTKMSTVIHGFLMVIAIVALPDVLNLIPMSALAGILIVTGYKLAKISIFKNVYKQGWKYFLPFMVTIIVMLFTDLLIGVACGVVVSFVFILAENMRIPYKVGSQKIEGRAHYLVQVSQHVTFLNKGSFVKLLDTIPENSHVTIDARKTTHMDRDVTELFNEYKRTAEHKNITLELLNVTEVEVIGH